MLKMLCLAIALAAGTLVGQGATAPADAAQLPVLGSLVYDNGVTDVRYRGGGGYRGGGYRGGYYARPYVYVGPPVAYYGYSTYSGGYCASLRRRAQETGSRYWWNRYRNEC